MNILLNKHDFMKITGACLLGLTFASTAQAQIPEDLRAKALAPDITHSIKQALEEESSPCGLEGAHHRHEHSEKMHGVLLRRDGGLTSDAARNLIFSEDAVSEHQMARLIESLGVMNAADTDKLLRAVYQHAELLAERFMPEDIEDDALAAKVKSSHVADIRAAVIAAIGVNKSRDLMDLVEVSAAGEGYVADAAQSVLKQSR